MSRSLLVQAAAERVGARPLGLGVPVAGEPAAGERAPRDDADALVAAQRQHLPLLLAVQEVVVVLHGDEAVPAVGVGREQRLRELPRPHRRRAEVADLAGLNQLLHRAPRLLYRSIRVHPVLVVEVDVVYAEPL